MSKKTMKKVIVAVITILMVVTVLTQITYAITIPQANTTSTPDEINTVAGRIIGALQTVGIAAAVIIAAVLGIKYMMGSAEEKAGYQKSFIPYIVGIAVLFLAPQLVRIIYELVTGSTIK